MSIGKNLRLKLNGIADKPAWSYGYLNNTRKLDTIVHLAISSFLDAGSAPPKSLVAGTVYVVPTGATGNWLGHDGDVALVNDDLSWTYYTPSPGWVCYSKSDDTFHYYNANQWVPQLGQIILGSPNFAGDSVTFNCPVTMNGTTTYNWNANYLGTVEFNNTATFNGPFTANSGLQINGLNLKISASMTHVEGAAQFDQTVQFDNSVTIEGELTTTGVTNLYGSIIIDTVEGFGASGDSKVAFGGPITVGKGTDSNAVASEFDGVVNFYGGVNFEGATHFYGDLNINVDNLTISGTTTWQVNGPAKFSGKVEMDGNIKVFGGMEVDSPTVINGASTFNSTATFNNVTTVGNAQFGSAVTITTDLPTSRPSTAGVLWIDGDVLKIS